MSAVRKQGGSTKAQDPSDNDPVAVHSGVFVAHESCARLPPHKRTTHTEHGLTFLVRGSISMEHGSRLRAEAGTITIMPAGSPHRLLGGSNLEYWFVSFCASCMELDEGKVLMSPFRQVRSGALPVLRIAKTRRRKVIRLFRELQEECKRALPESPELVRSLLLLLLGELRRANSISTEEHSGSLVADALTFIQRRCLEPISLRDVANAVHRSPAHVTATVKKETGYSVGEWINAGRVAEAARRLTHTNESLDEIAERIGWKDKTHFIRQFRKAHGITPAAWRRRERARNASGDLP